MMEEVQPTRRTGGHLAATQLARLNVLRTKEELGKKNSCKDLQKYGRTTRVNVG